MHARVVDFGPYPVRHQRLNVGHLGMRDGVEPGFIDLLRGSGDEGGESEIVGHVDLLSEDIRAAISSDHEKTGPARAAAHDFVRERKVA